MFIPKIHALWRKVEIQAQSPWLPYLLISAGVILRLRQFLSDRSLWLDEAYLALNIVGRDYRELLMPLNDNQAAPIGFLYLVKFLSLRLNSGELALRLLPFAFGCSSLPFFYWAAKRYLSAGSAAFALFLYAFCDQLIFYSAELKQYACDAAIGVFLLHYFHILREGKKGWLHWVLALLLGLASIALSHPAVFVIAGLGLTHLFQLFRQRESKSNPAILIWLSLYASLGCFFCALYFTVYKNAADNDFLLDYWVNGFLPLVPASFKDLQWYALSAFELFRYPMGLHLTGLAAFAALLGLHHFFRRQSYSLLALFLPLVLAAFASGIKKFPLEGRVAMFIVPFGLLLIAEGLGAFQKWTSGTSRFPGLLLMGLLGLHPLYYAAENALWPRQVEEFAPVLREVAGKRLATEPIYLFYGSVPSFHYYAPALGLNKGLLVQDSVHQIHWKHYDQVMQSLQAYDKAWFVFGHFTFDKTAIDYFRHNLDRVGERAETLENTGVMAFSYRFPRNTPPSPP